MGSVGWRGPINSKNGSWRDLTVDAAYKALTDIAVRENKKNDPDLAWAHVNNTAAACDFLVEHGVQFAESTGAMPTTYALEYEPDLSPGLNTFPMGPDGGSFCGSGIVRPTANAAVAAGAEILENHELTRLVVDASGKVCGGEIKITESTEYGVRLKPGAKVLYFKAKTAVMLGSGSWKGHLVLRKLLDPRIPDDMPHTGQPYAYNTGTGIWAAMQIGAAFCSDQSADGALWRNKFGTPWYNYRLDSGVAAPGITPNASAHAKYYIWVNKDGERYFNESNPISTAQSFDPSFMQEDMLVWMIFDEVGRSACGFDVTAPNCDMNYSFSDNTLEGLASQIGVSTTGLASTVSRYNGFVDAGYDEDFAKQPDLLIVKIENAPFYAVRVMFYIHDTAGGLWVNQDMQVKDYKGEIIPGLYAGGESAGGLAVIGLPRAITQGFIAGNHMIK
jgi:succinate dehydrogenase/fumarate reductase flavoprotein subunit